MTRTGLDPWTWRQQKDWNEYSTRRPKSRKQQALNSISYQTSRPASKNSEERRRLDLLRKRSELSISSSSKRSLSNQLNLTWCPSTAMAICRWWIHTCNLRSRILSTRIHLPIRCQAFSDRRSVVTCSATWCQASSNRSRIKSRSHSRALNWASLNLLSRTWANR